MTSLRRMVRSALSARLRSRLKTGSIFRKRVWNLVWWKRLVLLHYCERLCFAGDLPALLQSDAVL